jgi:hypothetical protein
MPDDHVETATVGGATVHGRYQVKGGYFLLRLGPSMHTQITEHLGLNASIGLAGAYAGTRYTATETVDIPNLGTDTSPALVSTLDPEQSDARRFVTGYYADLSLEWAANDTTGLFGGFTAQSISAYNQVLGARTARVDIGSSVGLRGGVSIKF